MKYVASMTTYPDRFKSALEVIKTIESQSKRPKVLVINISKEDWHKAKLDFIHQAKFLFSNHLIVKPCINLKPANKIIPTAKEYGDEIIITFDDDVLYPKDRAERLLKKHEEYPENPIAYRTRYIKFNNKNVVSYSDWAVCQGSEVPDKLHFPTSVSGNLYPPNFFPESFFDIDNYIKLSHNNDDIWTYFHILLKGSAFVKGGVEIVPLEISGSQKSALWKSNVSKGGNDAIIAKLEEKYGTLWELTK